jgi:phenylpyruvate tautomerase PptA (4-oxalocrotonate tautomerase family)
MPFIRITHPVGSLTADQKEKLASSLAYEVMAQELDPVTENSIAMTPVVFDEVEERNFFPGGKPLAQHAGNTRWIVEVVVAAAFFNQARRNALQTAVGKAFVDLLGDDGSEVVRGSLRISPAYLLHLHSVIVEIPEGNWGSGGQTIEIEEIGQILGSHEGMERLAEAQENAAKLKAARVS